MTEYDPKIILQFADRLYASAAQIVAETIALYAVVAAIAGYIVGSLLVRFYGSPAFAADPTTHLVLAGFAVGAVIGIFVGREKAFRLKLQAQMALVQLKIEENTRPAGDVSETPSVVRPQ